MLLAVSVGSVNFINLCRYLNVVSASQFIFTYLLEEKFKRFACVAVSIWWCHPSPLMRHIAVLQGTGMESASQQCSRVTDHFTWDLAPFSL